MTLQRANALADKDNHLKLESASPGANATDSMDTAVGAAEIVESIVFDGEILALPAGIRADAPIAIRDAIHDLIKHKEINVKLSDLVVTYGGGNLAIDHIGPYELDSITTDTATYQLARA